MLTINMFLTHPPTPPQKKCFTLLVRGHSRQYVLYLPQVRFENEEYRDLARKLQSEKSTLRKQPSSSSTGGGVAMGLTTETALMQIFDVEQLPLMPNHESMDSGSTDQLPFNQLTSFNSRAFRGQFSAWKPLFSDAHTFDECNLFHPILSDRTMARKLSELCQENKSLLLERDGIKRYA